MRCPSCNFEGSEEARYCGKCRMAFNRFSLSLTRARDHLIWILRRANAGFISGTVAWLFVPVLSAALARHNSDAVQFMAEGALGGAFLGAVEGLLEDSRPKTQRGLLLGGLGGGLAGLLFGHLSSDLTPTQMEIGIFLFWGTAGGAIGLVSSAWERKFKKMIAGIFAGFFGAGIGGWLGFLTYANLLQEFPNVGWVGSKLFQVVVGAVVGISLWFSIGVAERFIIFKRKQIVDRNHKHCERCENRNPLASWYCQKCGAVLQTEAKPEFLHLPKYRTLERVQQTLEFLSRLAAAAGFIAGTVFFIVFLHNPFLSIIALTIVAGGSYALMILFASLGEAVELYTSRQINNS